MDSLPYQTPTIAKLYSKYRAPLSTEVLSPILEYFSKSATLPLDRVVDAGCGTGQATNLIADYANHVIGVDISEAQILEAKKHPNPKVDYHVCSSEAMPFIEDQSVDLVLACASFHWFDQSQFIEECRRILKPRGVLSVSTYAFIEVKRDDLTEEQNKRLALVNKALRETLDDHLCLPGRLSLSKYKGVVLPFNDFQRLEMDDHFEADVGLLLGFYQSLAPFNKLLHDNPTEANELLESAKNTLKDVFCGELWKGDETPLTIIRPFVILLGRK